MRLIPGKTKVKMELFKGIRIPDILVAAVFLSLIILVLISNLSGGYYISVALGAVAAILLIRVREDSNYVFVLHVVRHLFYRRHYGKKKQIRIEPEADQDDFVDEVLESVRTAMDEDGRKHGKKAKQSAGKIRRAEKKLLRSTSAFDEEKAEIPLRRKEQDLRNEKNKDIRKDDKRKRDDMEKIIPFTGIEDDFICYGGEYYGAAVEVSPVEFRFYSPYRRTLAIENGLGRVLRSLPLGYAANIVKIDRPIDYQAYLASDERKLEDLRRSYEAGLMSEAEFRSRVEIMQDRLNMLRRLCREDQVVSPAYYIVLFYPEKKQLDRYLETAMETLSATGLPVHRLDSRELALFLKYTNEIDFDASELDRVSPEDYAAWAMPDTVDVKHRTVEVDHIITHNMVINRYPNAVGDGWLASLMSLPSTKVVIKCRPMDRIKSVRNIDKSLQELRTQYSSTGVDSKRIRLASHIESLSLLLSTLQIENETLLETNVYVTAYDIGATRANPRIIQPPRSLRRSFTNQKAIVCQYYQEENLNLKTMYFDQMRAFIGSQVSGFDPLAKKAQSIPSNSLAACYPWIFASVSDVGGIPMGDFEGVPVFVDFFRRDNERVNSNMVIVGKTGSGKSYATKSLLANLAADDSKIFVLDPENEYTELAENLHGKFINVGNAQQGRLNPFHIFTALEDDEAEDDDVSGSYAAHLQFLEEFFHQILPDCEKDALEYLNSLIDRLYTNMGITEQTDLSKLSPEDYPTFDNLYEAVLSGYQTANNEYVRGMLRTLTTYISKFSGEGRNANIWNGPSTVTTAENFTVFNFQSLLANRNITVANAQMLLVLKYIDNEIIKNRDYNEKYGLKRKLVVVIDEAHVFIDNKFPAALDFMYQLAKRIRKYNGMQIVITQNIKDFVGSEDIARKSSAIINACQYSMFFSLAPNDMQDLCKLYEKAGGINEVEQDRISTAPRGQAFAIISPQSRSTISVKAPEATVRLFQERNCGGWYFAGEEGDRLWEDFIGTSRERFARSMATKEESERRLPEQSDRKYITFSEITEEEYRAEMARYLRAAGKPESAAQPEPTVQPVTQPTVQPVTQPTVQPAVQSVQPIIQQVIQPVPQDSSRTEALLEKMFERFSTMNEFSYDSMVKEIRRNVRAELEASRTAYAPQSAPLYETPNYDAPQESYYAEPENDFVPPSEFEGDDLFEVPMSGEADDSFDLDLSSMDEFLENDLADDDVVELDEDDSEGGDSVALGSIFNADAMREAARLRRARQAEEDSDEDEVSDVDAILDDLDRSLDSLLDNMMDEIEKENVIDLMPTYHNTVIEVSLEELAQYNRTHY